jgi:hypothetical protein
MLDATSRKPCAEAGHHVAPKLRCYTAEGRTATVEKEIDLHQQ